ncbi:hypothetical protein [Novosphingobium sp. KA1]|nr:hypothetical protein [Novosphingobium sp. KA1]
MTDESATPRSQANVGHLAPAAVCGAVTRPGHRVSQIFHEASTMSKVRIGEWNIDLAQATASKGDIEVRIVTHEDGTYTIAYSGLESSETARLLGPEVLEAFQRAGAKAFEQGPE